MTDAYRRKLSRRATLASAAAILAGVSAFALRSGKTLTRRKTDARTLNRGNGAEPDTLDPHKASGNWENNVIGDMFMGLLTEDAAANAVPGAAESHSVSADGLVYTFKLRDHNWSDGTPVTAHDFVFSFRRIANPGTHAQYVAILYPIKNMQAAAEGHLPPDQIGVRALDDKTLEIEFQFTVPYYAQLFTHYTTFPVPSHVVQKYGDDWLLPRNIATNGAYVLKEWSPNDHIHIAKNPHFYDKDNVKIENIYFYPTQDYAAGLRRFRGGEFDMLSDSLPPEQIGWLKHNMPRELQLHPFILSQYVQFNFSRKPFDDLRVRRALSLAIDREIICSKIERAGEQPAYAFIPPGMPGYTGPSVDFEPLPMAERIAKAKWLLKQAGFGPANPLSFEYNFSNTTEWRLVGIAVQEMWAQVGAQVRLVSSESQVHYNLLRKHDFAVAWAGWIADYRDPKDYLFLFQKSTTDLNYGGYFNPRFETLVERSDAINDVATRADVLQQAEQILLDDVAIAPVFFGVTRDLVSLEVKGFVGNNVNINRSRYMSLDRGIADA
jgi:oligopeptide transport system substrate-binding protein